MMSRRETVAIASRNRGGAPDRWHRSPRTVTQMLTALSLIAFATSIGAVTGCSSQKGTRVGGKKIASDGVPDSAEQTLWNSSTRLTDQGVSKGTLLSDTTYVFGGGTRLELRGVNLTFYTSGGAKDGVLISRAGTYNSQQQRLDARGNVIVLREDGRRLTTPQLVFDQARNEIFSDSAFTFTEPGRSTSGIGFVTDPRLNGFRCLRACKAIAPIAVPTA